MESTPQASGPRPRSPLSDQTKERIRSALKGRPLSDDQKLLISLGLAIRRASRAGDRDGALAMLGQLWTRRIDRALAGGVSPVAIARLKQKRDYELTRLP